MVGLWPHPPGTLRALRTILGDMSVICRSCRRWTPLSFEREHADRPAEPCPFRCTWCRQRGDIVFPDQVPADFRRIAEEGDPAIRATG